MWNFCIVSKLIGFKGKRRHCSTYPTINWKRIITHSQRHRMQSKDSLCVHAAHAGHDGHAGVGPVTMTSRRHVRRSLSTPATPCHERLTLKKLSVHASRFHKAVLHWSLSGYGKIMLYIWRKIVDTCVSVQKFVLIQWRKSWNLVWHVADAPAE